MDVALVGCVAGKLDRSAAARDLFTSPMFKLARAFAERFDAWAILSARHGLVMPDATIEPYDDTMARMPAERRRAWWVMVGRQLRERWPDSSCHAVTFTCLAGADYLGCMTGLRYRDPMRRHSAGERSRWLREAAVLGHVDAAACCAHGASVHARGGGPCEVKGCPCRHLVPELHRTRRV